MVGVFVGFKDKTGTEMKDASETTKDDPATFFQDYLKFNLHVDIPS